MSADGRSAAAPDAPREGAGPDEAARPAETASPDETGRSGEAATPDETSWSGEAGWSGGGQDDAVVLALGTGAPLEPGEHVAPAVTVLRGRPDETELAALVAGIVASQAENGHGEDHAAAPSAWADLGRRLGVAPAPGPTTWRWSGHR